MTDQSRELVNQAITEVAAATRIRAFMPGYRDEISDADALGVAIANWADWDGEKIVEAFFSALEDANFHGERAKMLAVWNEPDPEPEFPDVGGRSFAARFIEAEG